MNSEQKVFLQNFNLKETKLGHNKYQYKIDDLNNIIVDLKNTIQEKITEIKVLKSNLQNISSQVQLVQSDSNIKNSLVETQNTSIKELNGVITGLQLEINIVKNERDKVLIEKETSLNESNLTIVTLQNDIVTHLTILNELITQNESLLKVITNLSSENDNLKIQLKNKTDECNLYNGNGNGEPVVPVVPEPIVSKPEPAVTVDIPQTRVRGRNRR
jgi:chromosome segregation ATPase